MATTKLQNMINPEVMGDMISTKLEKAIRFSPLAEIDKTLVGRPGNTVTVPKFKYIGDAVDVAEGQAIDLSLLETSSADFTIKKAGKGVEITDEAVLSGYGDPIGEANKQLLMAIANKIDNDCLDALATAPLKFEGAIQFNIDTISDALDLFGDEEDETKVLIMNPKDASKLRKVVGKEWERASDLGDKIIVNGTYGSVLGAQIVRSKKVAEGTAYIVKAGALAIFMKRTVEVEDDRDIIKKTTVITADQHYGAYLFDESKAIKIVLKSA